MVFKSLFTKIILSNALIMTCVLNFSVYAGGRNSGPCSNFSSAKAFLDAAPKCDGGKNAGYICSNDKAVNCHDTVYPPVDNAGALWESGVRQKCESIWPSEDDASFICFMGCRKENTTDWYAVGDYWWWCTGKKSWQF